MKRVKRVEDHDRRLQDIKKFASNREMLLQQETQEKLASIKREMNDTMTLELKRHQKVMIQGDSSIAQHVFLYIVCADNETYFCKEPPMKFDRVFKKQAFNDDVWDAIQPLLEWSVKFYIEKMNRIITLESEIDVSSIWEEMIGSIEHRTLGAKVITKYMASRVSNREEVVVHPSVFYRLSSIDGIMVRVPAELSTSKRLYLPTRVESLGDLLGDRKSVV